MNYNEWVYNWFEVHTGINSQLLKNNSKKNFFEAGWIDSFQFIELLSDIEELGIVLSSTQFEDRSFSTIDGMINILQKLGEESK